MHPETGKCHPEPFDGLRIDSAKDLEILRRVTPQNDTQGSSFRMGTNSSSHPVEFRWSLSRTLCGAGMTKKIKEKDMPQYIISYLGGDQPSSPEEGKQHFAKYKEWLSSLGDSAVSPANPLKDTSTVNPDGSVIT